MMTHSGPSTLTTLRTAAAAACLTLGAWASPAEDPASGTVFGPAAAELRAPVVGDEAASSGWIADEADNVCGVRVARQVTHPASVRYEELLDATPEMQRMKREGISRDSAQGQLLYAAAVDRVRRAATRIMGSGGYCSVWKQIRHRDGRAVRDVTADVRAEL